MTDDLSAPNAPAAPRAGRRRLIIGAWGAGALAVAGGIMLFRVRRDAVAHDGSALLGVVLPDADGHPQGLGQWRGSVLIVNFWATWCVPCREEMPLFVEAQTRNAANGVQFVGIAVDEPAKVRQFSREIGLNYPVLIGGYGAVELSKTLGNDHSALPFTIVLDRRGRVAHTQLGPLRAAKLDDVLSRVLKAG